jgi:alpha-1,2-mannosyltransferase
MRSALRSRMLTAAVLTALTAIGTWFVLALVSTVNPVDFLVYRYGATAALAGGGLYDGNLSGPMLPDGGMPFTYTPFAALLLAPTALLGWHAAYVLWSLGSLAIVAWVVERFTPRTLRRRPLVVGALMVAATATTMVTQHLSYGQVNLPLMALVLWDATRSRGARSTRMVPRGLLVGIAAAVKLTPGLFVVYFLLTRQWRAASWAIAGAAGATLLAALVHPDLSRTFWTEVIWHLDQRVDFTGSGFATFGNNSLQGVLAAVGAWTSPVAVPLTVLAGAVALALAYAVHRRGRSTDALLVVGLAAPILSPISWIHHWVYLLPAGVVLLTRRRRPLTYALTGVGYVLLVIGPGLGQLMLERGPLLLAPLAVASREILLLASVVAIVALARDAWRLPPPPTRA